MLVSLYMSKAWQTYKDANVAAEAGRWGWLQTDYTIPCFMLLRLCS